MLQVAHTTRSYAVSVVDVDQIESVYPGVVLDWDPVAEGEFILSFMAVDDTPHPTTSYRFLPGFFSRGPIFSGLLLGPVLLTMHAATATSCHTLWCA